MVAPVKPYSKMKKVIKKGTRTKGTATKTKEGVKYTGETFTPTTYGFKKGGKVR